MKKKVFLAKLLRTLKITKPIDLSVQEKNWIKLCKGHFNEKYDVGDKNWIDTLKPLFNETYGWTAEEYYDDFLDCIFNKLLDIHLKVQSDYSGSNLLIREIIKSSFAKRFDYQSEKPIERVISELCSKIQMSQVIENGVNRYYL